MMKRFSILLLLVLIAITMTGQDTIPERRKKPKDKVPLNQKMYFGLSGGVLFGSYTQIAVYPLVGFKAADNYRIGIQPGYEYINDKSYGFKASNYGISVINQYDILPNIYLHAEPAVYGYDAYYLPFYDKERVWVPHLFLGGGINQHLGGRAALFIQVSFDVIQDPNSPYLNWTPFYGFGVRSGF